MGRITRVSFAIVLGTLCASIAVSAAWCGVYRMYVSALALGVLTTVFIPLAVTRKPVWIARAVVLGTCVGIALVGWKTPCKEYARSTERLTAKKLDVGPGGFSTRDLAGIYGFSLIMTAAGALAGYSEVATESWRLHRKGPANRSTDSNFAMRSPKVRAAITKIVATLQTSQTADRVVSRTVTWGDYRKTAAHDSLRVALALNCPCVLTANAHHTRVVWRMEMTATCEVRYPRQHIVRIGTVDGIPILLDEGLFWVLQERGWMHPFRMEYHWIITSDELAGQDPQSVDRDWRERLLRRVWSGVRT